MGIINSGPENTEKKLEEKINYYNHGTFLPRIEEQSFDESNLRGGEASSGSESRTQRGNSNNFSQALLLDS